ncbi:MAG TPA: tetratricopeptide repeat protein [Thermoanaerobaculia bacterium]|jgi:tetratricopeptide (TPR) repeat protein|nr:tetratricopeptide repeat protein [Thermoanaerobaculia bacterium]
MKHLLALTLALLVSAIPAVATCGGGGGGGVGGISPSPQGFPQEDLATYRVSWTVLSPGDPAPAGAWILYWFPTSPEEARASELLSSRVLTLAAGRCVAMALVPVNHAELHDRYQVAAGTASAILVSAADGAEIGRAAIRAGQPLGRAEVEKMLDQALDQREKSLDAQLDGAKANEKKGDAEGAAALYGQVWEQRCLAPRLAKKAAKALEKMGRPVAKDARLDLPLPDASRSTETRIARALSEGLRAENDLDLPAAAKAYERARRIDPADPVPLRYLGELYRHHTGEWDKAREAFARLLDLPADPLSRAVALHGLGKMTIHDGEFAKGLGLFEQSAATYPLPLTYRNLAVYWNSEGQFDKAYGYVQKAIALDPEDPYNQIFAATYLIQLGKPEEAARIARENDSLLPASYNLAAIWAQLGQGEKAIELLARHFYKYEQRPAVRQKEMEEARVDAVFVTLRQDPAFVELIANADHATGMR